MRDVSVHHGIMGFDRSSGVLSSRPLRFHADLPVIVEAVGSREGVEASLSRVREVLDRGLITLAEVELHGPGGAPDLPLEGSGGRPVWQPLAAFVAGAGLGAALPAVLLAARNACRRAGLGLRTTAFLSLLTANGAALADGTLVAWIAGRHELAIAASSVVCGLAVLVAAVSVGGEGEQR